MLSQVQTQVEVPPPDIRVYNIDVTTYSDQKIVVSKALPPREVDTLRHRGWEELCDNWHMKVVGDPDSSFFTLEVPKGWQLRVKPGSALWSEVIDDKGRERATVYYADPAALIYLTRRYAICSHYLDPTDKTVRIVCGEDGRRIFREFGRVMAGSPRYKRELAIIEQRGKTWFDMEFPGWRSPFAYWEFLP